MLLKINDRIRNRQVDFFDSFEMSLRYDSIASTFSFQGYFDPDNQEHKDLYCIGHYHNATIEHNGERLLTGTILSERFISSSKRKIVPFSGYSLTGVLEDCEIPDSISLQSDGLTLREIAEKLVTRFGIKIIIDPAVSKLMDMVYEKTTAGEAQTIKACLTELAAQRDIIVSHNAYGNLVFTKANTKRKPILDYGGSGLPCPDMELDFNGQAMHSHITAIKQADDEGGNVGRSELRNPFVRVGYRPKVVVQSSGNDVDTELVARRARAAELKNVKLKITTDRWDIDGKIILPNNTITVVNPEVYLYKRSTWFIEEVSYKGDSKSLTATMNCVLPEVYSGEDPHYLWEGINLH